MTHVAIKSFWQKPIAIARSIDERQLGLVLPIGVMIRNPAGGSGDSLCQTATPEYEITGAELVKLSDAGEPVCQTLDDIKSWIIGFDPCAGATPSIQILSLEGEYDVYINDALIVSGDYQAIFSALLFAQGVVFEQSGVLTSHRDTTIAMRFERTDAGTIDFDALGNPTASLVGNILTFCLSSTATTQSVLFDQGLDLSQQDEQGFVSVAPEPSSCGGEVVGTFFVSSQEYLQMQYRVTQQLAAGETEHIFAAITSFIGFTLRYNFDGLFAANTLLSPQLPISTVITAQFAADGVAVSWLDQSIFVAYDVDADLLVLPFFGGIWSVILGNSNGLCDAVPMEIRIGAAVPAVNADTLQGVDGAYYLSRANHTGSQAISTVVGLQSALGTLTDTDADLQAQINDVRRAKIPAVAGRYYTNCNLGGTFSSSSVAAGQLRTVFFEPLADMTIDQIGVFLTAAPTAGARIKLAVYEFDPANANSLLLVHSVPEIVADATIGAKLVATGFTFRLGRFYVITHLSDSALAMRNFSASAGLAAGLATVDATAPITLWVATGVAYSATAPATLNLTTFGTLTSNTSLILMRGA